MFIYIYYRIYKESDGTLDLNLILGGLLWFVLPLQFWDWFLAQLWGQLWMFGRKKNWQRWIATAIHADADFGWIWGRVWNFGRAQKVLRNPLLSAPHDSAAAVATDALACFHACKLPTSDSNRISENDTKPLFIMFGPLDPLDVYWVYFTLHLESLHEVPWACHVMVVSNHHWFPCDPAWSRRKCRRQSTAEFCVARFEVPADFANSWWPLTRHMGSCLLCPDLSLEGFPEWSNSPMQSYRCFQLECSLPDPHSWRSGDGRPMSPYLFQTALTDMRFVPQAPEAKPSFAAYPIFEIRLQWPVDRPSSELEIPVPFPRSWSWTPSPSAAVARCDLCIPFSAAAISGQWPVHAVAAIRNPLKWCHSQGATDTPPPWWHPIRCHHPSNPRSPTGPRERSQYLTFVWTLAAPVYWILTALEANSRTWMNLGIW